ncbi:MAG: bifunctional DNA primase/polymerase, partial [Chloroflexota bacterium]
MDYPNKLYKKGVFYRRLGYSVVPVYGHHSPTRPKAAAVRWADYQKRPPTVEELDDWFLKRQFGGMAIVCGEVSQLAVLDFDDPELAARFAVLHPQLTDTFTVLSGQRGLPHYYFHVPSGLTTRSRSIKGVDWQYNGRYVIAPPTTFEDASWRVASDVLPRTLNQNDLEWIMTFLDEQTTQYPSETPAVNIPQVPDRITQLSLSLELTPERVTHHYLSQVHLGRNNALFATCCWVRDCGGTVDQASVLVRIHASQPAYGYHMPESMDKRRGEALRTIQSAFSRPSGFRAGYRYRFIPNSLREHLLQHKQTALLRVLEVVVKAGWRAGKQFTRAMLLKACAPFQIGDWSIRKALAARTPQKKTVFEEVATAAFAAKVSGDIPPQLNAIELRATEPTQNRGRPARCYVMPDLRDLCFEFDVEWSAGDAIADADLQTVATYRRTLHQRLIQRRPGQYHRGWLANRLGVSVRTLNRYNNHLNMTLTPVYKRRFITWRTLGHMPDDLREHQMGAFLEDESGKRYPPLLPIARRLLRNKHQVVFNQRMANRYELPVPVDVALPDASATIQSPSST